MDDLTQSLLTENEMLRERCSTLSRRVEQQNAEFDRLRQMYEKLIEMVATHQRYTTPVIVPFQYGAGCPKCGVGSGGGPLGYVCNDPMCPCGLGGVQCSASTIS